MSFTFKTERFAQNSFEKIQNGKEFGNGKHSKISVFVTLMGLKT